MSAEFISFGVFITVYIILSWLKTAGPIKRFTTHNKHQYSRHKSTAHYNLDVSDAITKEEQDEKRNSMCRFIKLLINYSVSFNSSFLIVGSISEAYFYGVRMFGNVLSVSLGYVYAFLIVQPFMYSLDEDIKTPYQYFERRYRHSRWIRAITASAGLLFYLSFLALYLWGCAILLNTLFPHLPLWLCSILIGAYSIAGSCFGGFTQSTKINLIQFLLLLAGLICSVFFSINKEKEFKLSQLWSLAAENKRTVFIDTNVDLTTRYTILNQAVSLALPWTAFHSLLLPNFMRYRAVKGKTKSRFFIISNFPCMVLTNLLILVPGGIVVYLYFYGCSPLFSQKILNKNQIGTYWMHLVLTQNMPAFCGIVFASILAFSVVQHSSGISLLSSTALGEIFIPLICPDFRFDTKLKNKCVLVVTLVFGTISVLYSIGFAYVQNTMISLFFVFNNSIHSPILGLFFLSAFNPYANGVGAMLAFCSNLAINFFLAFGAVFSRLTSQEFPPETFECESEFHSNLTSLNPYNVTSSVHHYQTSGIYYPKNAILAYLFSVAPIWYCLFSVVYTAVCGSLFSLVYSLVATRSLDADYAFADERSQYLYFNRMFKQAKNKKSKDLTPTTSPLISPVFYAASDS